MIPALFLTLVASLTPASQAGAAELSGRVELFSPGKEKRLKSTEVSHAVVYFEPAGGVPSRARAAAPKRVDMVTQNKEFLPRVLPVVVGTSVRFPNRDPILHNVFSVSPGNSFDLGLYRQGDGESYTFTRPGLVRVFCNVHYSMIAYVVVLETPYFTSPGEDGGFRLRDLPEGAGTLHVWYERAEPVRLEVQVPAAGPLDVALELTRRRVPPHTNKFGKPYKRGGSGDRYQ